MTWAKRRSREGFLFLIPYGTVFTAFIVLPIVVSFILSLMRFDLTDKKSISFSGVQHYSELWHDTYFWQALSATLHYVFLNIPLLIGIALGIAFGLNNLSKGQTAIRAVVFVPGIFTIAVTAIIWQWFYNLEFGLFNYLLKGVGMKPVMWLSSSSLAMPSVVAMNLWWTAGGTGVIFLAALQQIPTGYVEAALLDGANGWQLFSKILMPQLRPVTMFIVITSTIAAFQMFPQAYLLTSGGPEFTTRSIVQLIYETAFNNYRFGYAAAISWTLTALIAIVALAEFFLLRKGVD